jgi:Flp pilus assembly protein TadG
MTLPDSLPEQRSSPRLPRNLALIDRALGSVTSQGRPAKRRDRESGSAVADFAMVSGLLSLMFLAVFQLGLALHIRNTLISCASEGARYGARANATPQDGVARASQLIRASLSDRYAENVTATATTVDGIQVLQVRIQAPLPVLGPLGPDRVLSVQARAFLESQ